MKKIFAVVLFLMTLIIFPSAAFAADTTPDNILVSLWPEYSNEQVFFMQQIKLPAAMPLPATVNFAFPSDAQMQWTGEILGTNTAQDIAATPTITQKDGYQEVTITLTKSRVAQAEAIWNGLTSNGNSRSVALAWTQRYDSKTTTFEFLEPSKASNITMTPVAANTRQSPEGFTYHLTSPKVLAVGQVEQFNVTYTRAITTPSVADPNAAAATGQTSTGAKNPVSNWVLLAILVAAGAGIAAFVYREKTKENQNGPTAGKKAVKNKDNEAKSTPSKKPLFAVLAVIAILGIFAVYTFTNTGSVPSGNNCQENITYLQKGVDAYKAAWGIAPTNLRQLLDKKDGKGPFVETITLKCPTDGTYYAVKDGKITQSESTQAP